MALTPVPYHTHQFEIPTATTAEILAGTSTTQVITPAELLPLLTSIGALQVATFASRAIAETQNIPADIDILITSGGAVEGDGHGGTYQKMLTPTVYGITTADGAFWEVISSVMTVGQFGALTFANAQKAITHAAASGAVVDFRFGDTYAGGTGDTLDVPDNSILKGDAYFTFSDPAPTGTAAGTTIVTIGDHVTFERFRVLEPGGAAAVTSNYVILIGDDLDAGYIGCRSTVQREKVGIQWEAQVAGGLNGSIGKVLTRNCDRALMIENIDPSYDPEVDDEKPYPTNIEGTSVVIGDIDIENFATGFKPQFVNYLITGTVSIRGRSPYTNKRPGANCIISRGCPRMDYQQPIYLSDAGEHAMRIGNPEKEDEEDGEFEDEDAGETYLHIPWMFISDCGGCGLKATQKASTFSEIVVGGLTCKNVGMMTFGHGEELVRLSKMDRVQIGPIRSAMTEGIYWEDWLRPEEFQRDPLEHPEDYIPVDVPNDWPRAAVQMNDVSYFEIGPIYGNYRQMLVDCYGESDMGNVGGGPVEHGKILIGDATCEGGNAVRFYSTPETTDKIPDPTPMTVGDITFEMVGAGGWDERVYAFGRPDSNPPFVTVTEPIYFVGFHKSSSGEITDSDEVGLGHELIEVNLEWKGKRRQGRAQALRRNNSQTQFSELVAATENAFTPTNVAPTGMFINNSLLAEAPEAEGMAIEWSQLSTDLRGAAIVPVQIGGDPHEMGIDIYTGPSGSSTDALTRFGRFAHTGHFQMGNGTPTTVIDNNRIFRNRVYTVGTLPAAGTAGRVTYCSDLRVFNGAGTQEGAAAGTGGLVVDNGSAWKIMGTNVTAVA